MSDLTRRARQHGTKSKYAGGEPRNRELTEHWPKPKPKMTRPHFPPLPKRLVKLRRKDKINCGADTAVYQARLATPWRLYTKEGVLK